MVMFNRNQIKFGKSIEPPSLDILKNTPQLWNASLEDALKYGGELTKAAIGTMDLKFDRKYIVVDTKVHMLMPGMCPAIPNWHTDGVPRGLELKPEIKAAPNIYAQENMSKTHYHLMVTGHGCLTEFVNNPLYMDIDGPYNKDLNKIIHEKTELAKPNIIKVPSCTVIEFDWWNIHRGVPAALHEWRYLIRVAETDHMEPQTDLRKILRTQIQVYVPNNFAW